MSLKWSCKPSSVSAGIRQAECLHAMSIHLGRQLPGASCGLPGSQTRRATSPPLFGLAPGEVYHAAFVAEDAVSSYLTISPLPALRV